MPVRRTVHLKARFHLLRQPPEIVNQLSVNIKIYRRHLLTAVAVLVSLNLVFMAGTYVFSTLPREGGWRALWLAGQFSLGLENVVAAWYASMLLLLVGLAAIACFALDIRHYRSGRTRAVSYGWLVFAVVFAGLSLDELGSLHEHMGALQWLQVVDLSGWTGPLLVPIVAVALFMAVFAFVRVRRSPTALVLMFLGILLFLSVLAQEHLELSLWKRPVPGSARNRPPVLEMLEEGTEIFGSLSFLAACVVYAWMLLGHVGSRRAQEKNVREFHLRLNIRRATRAMLGVGAVIIAGAVLFYFAYLPFVDVPPQYGNPVYWFATTLTFLVALGCFSLWLTTPGSTRTEQNFLSHARIPLLFLGLFALVLSLDHGTAHILTDWLWNNSEGRRFLVDLVLIGATLLLAASLWSHYESPLARAGIGSWALLLSFGLLAGGTAAIFLSLFAHAALLPSLLQITVPRGPHPVHHT